TTDREHDEHEREERENHDRTTGKTDRRFGEETNHSTADPANEIRAETLRSSIFGSLVLVATWLNACSAVMAESPNCKLRVIIETDAGGDPDDEQSLVRFLLYTNEWDVEGIIANRSQ